MSIYLHSVDYSSLRIGMPTPCGKAVPSASPGVERAYLSLHPLSAICRYRMERIDHRSSPTYTPHSPMKGIESRGVGLRISLYFAQLIMNTRELRAED